MATVSHNISVLNQAVSILSQQVSVLSQQVSVLSATPPGSGSVTSTELSAVSAQAASAISVLSQQVSVLSQQVSVLSQAVSVVSAAVANVSAVSAGGTAVGLQSVVNALSNRISAIPGAGSVNAVAVVGNAQTISATTLANVSGMLASVSAAKLYRLEGYLLFSVPSANVGKFGMTFPAMTRAGAHLWGATSILAGAAASSFSSFYAGEIGIANTGAVAVSVAFGVGNHAMGIDGAFLVSTGGAIQLQAAGSVGTAPIVILPGSYMRVFKLN